MCTPRFPPKGRRSRPQSSLQPSLTVLRRHDLHILDLCDLCFAAVWPPRCSTNSCFCSYLFFYRLHLRVPHERRGYFDEFEAHHHSLPTTTTTTCCLVRLGCPGASLCAFRFPLVSGPRVQESRTQFSQRPQSQTQFSQFEAHLSRRSHGRPATRSGKLHLWCNTM